jgi:hypothetical protein
MDLPQELLDGIFSHLPSDGGKTLRACALVARTWVYPAQRLLFSSIRFNTDTYQSWEKAISPANTELLTHIRSLHYFTRNPHPRHRIIPHVNALAGYLPSFRQLQILTLSGMRVNPDCSQGIFSAFQHTLSSLSLREVSLPWVVFAALVDYFPSLRNLEVRDPNYDEDDRQSTTLSKPLYGKLFISTFTDEALATFSDKLPGLPVAYDELTIGWSSIARPVPRYYQQIIDTCAKSLKRLNLHPSACFIQSANSSRIKFSISSEQFSGSLSLFRTSPGQVPHNVPSRNRTRCHLFHYLHKHPYHPLHITLPRDATAGQALHAPCGRRHVRAYRQIVRVGVRTYPDA